MGKQARWTPTAGWGRARVGQGGQRERNQTRVRPADLPCSAETGRPGLGPQQGALFPYALEQGEEERPWPQDLQPPPPPGPHEDGQEEKSSTDERPATEPLFKVLDTPLSEGDEPTTLPAQRDRGHSVQMEGFLGRKHDLEGPNKKASNRCVGEGPWGHRMRRAIRAVCG